jgi:AhpD family alkylhydroperoxidase
MFYGPDFSAVIKNAASYIDRILKGAQPADLPVEQPTKFDLLSIRAADPTFSSETVVNRRKHHMSKDYAQIANDVVTGVGLLRQGAPDTARAFGSLLTAATATKALDTKTKELMALAIGIAVHCEGCVAYHTKMAHQHGAAREEVVETVALAVYMGGGPATVYGGDALRAYDQFSGT